MDIFGKADMNDVCFNLIMLIASNTFKEKHELGLISDDDYIEFLNHSTILIENGSKLFAQKEVN